MPLGLVKGTAQVLEDPPEGDPPELRVRPQGRVPRATRAQTVGEEDELGGRVRREDVREAFVPREGRGTRRRFPGRGCLVRFRARALPTPHRLTMGPRDARL